MKRSNRLVLLVGVFLAIVAFIGILLISQGGGTGTGEPVVPTVLPTVVAKANIPLGSRIQAGDVEVLVKPVTGRDADAFGDTSQVIGKVVRENVTAGAAVTARTLTGGATGQILDIVTPPGRRAMAVQVDQVTGVGTVIKTGDYVDMIIGLAGAEFPVITTNPVDSAVTVVTGLNGTSVKVVLPGLQVVGTLLPPVAATPQASPGTAGTTAPGTALADIQEIVILSVTAQQAEVIRFAQISGTAPLGAVSLVLRSTDDFIDPKTNLPLVPVVVKTTGITLKTLVDSYGVLPPEVIQAVLPKKP